MAKTRAVRHHSYGFAPSGIMEQYRHQSNSREYQRQRLLEAEASTFGAKPHRKTALTLFLIPMGYGKSL